MPARSMAPKPTEHLRSGPRSPSRDREGRLSASPHSKPNTVESPPGADSALGDGRAPSTVLGASPGKPLDPPDRQYFEGCFGRGFGDVRLHTDEPAGRAAAARGALAFTLGADIVMGRPHARPGTPQHRALLAHELAHVVQQGQVARTPLHDPPIGPSSGHLEQEADAAATAALAGRPARVTGRTSGPLLQRATTTPGQPSFPLPDGRKLDGTMLESLLMAVPLIAPFVSARKLEKGITAVGHTQFLAPGPFEDRFVAYAQPNSVDAKTDPRTGQSFDTVSVHSFARTVHGFVDRDTQEAFVKQQQDGRDANEDILQTSIHEAVHLFGSPSFAGYWGHHAVEGMTDFFMRIVCAAHDIDPGKGAYKLELSAVEPIIDLGYMTIEDMAQWYFKDYILFERKHPDIAKAWAEHMKTKGFVEARSTLRNGKP